jgi:hypothetical protein
MNKGIEGRPTQESEPERFAWRAYLRNPEKMSAEGAARLDILANLLQGDGSAAAEFMMPLRNGQYKGHPVQAFVQFFRDILEDGERSRLLGEIERCTPVGYERRAE